MKKKHISIFLTLAMVLTMLPLSALAASWTVEFPLGTTFTLIKYGNTVTSEPDQNQYYTFRKASDDLDSHKLYVFDKVDDGFPLSTSTGTPV